LMAHEAHRQAQGHRLSSEFLLLPSFKGSGV
jgi:hypothetical protein